MMRRRIAGWPGTIAGALLCAAPVAAQVGPLAARPPVQTAAEAMAQDAASYARRYGLQPGEAALRLQALQASAPVTDAIRATHRARLVGVAIEHRPRLQIAVLLTGTGTAVVPLRELVLTSLVPNVRPGVP